MGVIWHKIWFDIWHNKTRTFLSVLSIASGVFAVGAIFGMTDMLLRNMDASHRAVLPSHVTVSLDRLVDRDTILALQSIPGVEGVEPNNGVTVQYKLHPEDPWRQGVIMMRDQYAHQKYELFQLRQGHWPSRTNEISVERMAAQFLNVGMGDSVIFKINDRERQFPITGLIRHPFVPPPQFMDVAYFFMSAEGMERLGIPAGQFGGFYMRVTPYSEDHAKEVATLVKDKLARQNIGISGFLYEDPEKHWGRTFFNTITKVEQALAVICMIISAILVFNTVSNLITQQTNQIGILKAIGARMPTIVGLYLVGALIFGAMSLAIALPLGALVANGITRVFLNLFNIDFPGFHLSRQAVFFQVISAIVAPLFAALPPVLKGASVTVRQAIASYGIGSDFHSGRVDRLVEKIGQRWLPSYYATALGNMFRHKGRLIMTQVVLVAAGSAFLMVMSLNSSLDRTLDDFFGRQRYDIVLGFRNDQRADRAVAIAESVEGVEKAQIRFYQQASLLKEGQLIKDAGIGTTLIGIPATSDFFTPLMISGRWFAAGDGRAIVIPRSTAEDNNLAVGDSVTLDMGVLGQEQWQVVGIYEPVFAGGFASVTVYAPIESLFQITKKYDQAGALLIRTTEHDDAFTTEVTRKLKEAFERHSLRISSSQTQADLRATNEWQFSTVTYMLMALSIILAIVGAFALMGVISIGVIERTKEIGVLRAIGARSPVILKIFVMEGLLQGILSWLIAVPISLLASPGAASAMGKILFGASLSYRYNWPAVWIWLLIVGVISILASILPARGAVRISVRDSLAYA